VAAIVAERLHSKRLKQGVFHIEQVFDPEEVLDLVADHGITVEHGVSPD